MVFCGDGCVPRRWGAIPTMGGAEAWLFRYRRPAGGPGDKLDPTSHQNSAAATGVASNVSAEAKDLELAAESRAISVPALATDSGLACETLGIVGSKLLSGRGTRGVAVSPSDRANGNKSHDAGSGAIRGTEYRARIFRTVSVVAGGMGAHESFYASGACSLH